jgi:hypothetical protein
MSTNEAQYLGRPSTWSRVYEWDFSDFDELEAGETISSPAVTADPSGLTIGTPSVSGSSVFCRLSGGTAGVTYEVTCAVTLSSGGTLDMVGRQPVT